MSQPQVIGKEAKFYGYIVGLHLEPGNDPLEEQTPTRMYATFEYGSGQTIWEVPDFELFRLLSEHLNNNAHMRSEHGDYGYSKLWIEFKADGWDVDLP